MSSKKLSLEKTILDIRFVASVLFIPLLISPKGLEELFLADALVWGIAVFVTDRKGMRYVLGDKLFWINLCYPLILFLTVTIVNGLFIKHSILLPIMIFYGLYYEQKDFKSRECRMGIAVSIAYLVLIHIYTLVILYKNADVSRLLASSVYSERYGDIWTGGYAHTYTTMLMCIVIFAMILKCKNKIWRYIMIFTEGLSALFLINAGYTMALLFTAGGILLVSLFELSAKNKGKIIILMGIIFLPVILWMLGHVITFFATNVPNRYMQSRLKEVANLLLFNGIKSGGSFTGRFELYRTSAETFLRAPLVGVGNSNLYRKVLYGGHSTFLDKLACFGLLGGGTYIILILYNFKNICSRIEKNSQYIYISAFAFYILLSIMNISDVIALYTVVYLLIPIMICIFDDKRREKNECFNDL